ncbi:cytochrome P450 [Spartinivicinus poritis]|uniref:Cytochrome P450 n=1 Tax=Spartinivicinus poritis TaxID=2994640 RepID=A0ABT5U704_9GAMM|nr:cytochrome P450 [Spartinivicinus sp. A2-2]MDE1462142.1 cytochrome P450 [Spartinivicinus sp. A2-2]
MHSQNNTTIDALTTEQVREIVQTLYTPPNDWSQVFLMFQGLHQTPATAWQLSDNYYVVADYPTVQHVLRSDDFSANRVRGIFKQSKTDPSGYEQLIQGFEHWVLFKDGESHILLRRCINQAFSRQILDKMLPMMEECVDYLLSPFLAQSKPVTFDLIKEVAFPLPMLVIAKALGAKAEDALYLKQLSDRLTRLFFANITPAILTDAEQALFASRDYFLHLINQHRQQPQDNLLGALLSLQDTHSTITDQCMADNCSMLLLAGHETTTSTIGNLFYFLDEQKLLCSVLQKPDLYNPAIEETLRYSCPVQSIRRIATKPVNLHQHQVQPGDCIEVLLGAACRDPNMFEQPNQFKLDRQHNKHLAFGYARHLCSGAQLSRLEMQVILNHLGSFSIAVDRQQARWRQQDTLVGLESLPITIQ